MLKMILVPLALFASASFAQLQAFSVGDVAVMQANVDGTYSVVCKNGNRETVTDLDLRLGNVCPNIKESQPTGILSLQFRDDGQFDVVCRDLTKVVASPEEIMAGSVCVPPQPQVALEDGSYKSDGGYYCPQEVTTAHDDGRLVSLRIRYVGGCNAYSDYTCTNDVCVSTDGSYTATILTRTSYRFKGSGATEIFSKVP